jgi:WhiB family redox-sensing transcriptional regulator
MTALPVENGDFVLRADPPRLEAVPDGQTGGGEQPALGLLMGMFGWDPFEPTWQTDPEAFFPENGGSTREAKRICTSCEVRSQCLEYALDHDERFGIWGGLSERERRRLKRRNH